MAENVLSTLLPGFSFSNNDRPPVTSKPKPFVQANTPNLQTTIAECVPANLSEQAKLIIENKDRFSTWMKCLKKTGNDQQPLEQVTQEQIMSVDLDLRNQRVINYDCLRMSKKGIMGELRTELECFLTFYCKRENIFYNQGLNEMAAPFILFRKQNTDLGEIYNCFILFINRYARTTYKDKQFVGMNCNLRMIKLLMKYHEPELYLHFRKYGITPEMYSIPWFLTLLTYKQEIYLMYALCDLYILQDDPELVLFIGLAYIAHGSSNILKSGESEILQYLSNLKFESTEHLNEIYKKALSYMSNTPPSFMELFRKLVFSVSQYLEDPSKKTEVDIKTEFFSQLHSITSSPSDILASTPTRLAKFFDPEYLEALPHLDEFSHRHMKDRSQKTIIINTGKHQDSSKFDNCHLINLGIINDDSFSVLGKQLQNICSPGDQVILATTRFDSTKFAEYLEEETQFNKTARKNKRESISKQELSYQGVSLSEEAKILWIYHKLLKRKMTLISVLENGTDYYLSVINKVTEILSQECSPGMDQDLEKSTGLPRSGRSSRAKEENEEATRSFEEKSSTLNIRTSFKSE